MRLKITCFTTYHSYIVNLIYIKFQIIQLMAGQILNKTTITSKPIAISIFCFISVCDTLTLAGSGSALESLQQKVTDQDSDSQQLCRGIILVCRQIFKWKRHFVKAFTIFIFFSISELGCATSFIQSSIQCAASSKRFRTTESRSQSYKNYFLSLNNRKLMLEYAIEVKPNNQGAATLLDMYPLQIKYILVYYDHIIHKRKITFFS